MHRITVLNEWPRRLVTKPLREALLLLLTEYKALPGEVTVVLADDPRLQTLNRDFRQIDSPTDVLTFPAPPHAPGTLGDIVISLDFAEKQAKIRGVRLIDEAAMLAVHGGLHLLGFDDHTEPERADMVRRMNEVMVKAGLPTDEDWASLPHGEPL